jgi:hypothetical protein
MKVFISYSTEDKPTAESLYSDISGTGAEVFEYGRSETIGKLSWEEILSWIGQSDVFVVLMSESAIRSTAVREEIAHAHYSYINSNRTKPSKLVPAMLQKKVEIPVQIQRFTRVDFINYRQGLGLLLKQLGLKRQISKSATTSKPRSPFPASYDFDQIWASSKKSSRKETEKIKWSEDVNKILSNYSMVKPTGISQKGEAKHIDSILEAYSGKASETPGGASALWSLNSAFLGFKPSQHEEKKEAEPKWPDLGNLLLNYDSSMRFRSLSAPKLELSFLEMLRWSAVPGALGYILEESSSPGFDKSEKVYSGTETMYSLGFESGLKGLQFRVRRQGPSYFRVKATGGVFRPDSPWSNTVKHEPKLPKSLPAPALTVSSTRFGTSLSWSSIEGASGYVLERGVGEGFIYPIVIYEGDRTAFVDTGGALIDRPALAAKPDQRSAFYYRVKAKGGTLHPDSHWSKSVKNEPAGLGGFGLQKDVWKTILDFTSDKLPLASPSLKASSSGFGTTLTWTTVKSTKGYVLERSTDRVFSKPQQIYEGEKTTFFDIFGTILPTLPNLSSPFLSSDASTQFYYRVKAKGGKGFQDSEWSEVVSLAP